jgi:hypothetical protein
VYAGEGFAGEELDEWKSQTGRELDQTGGRAETCFEDVNFKGTDARYWKVEGEEYLRPGEMVGFWEGVRDILAEAGRPTKARGNYRILSLSVHPQSFASHPALRGQEPMHATMSAISGACVTASASMLDAVGVIIAYTGWGDAPGLWEHLIRRTDEISGRYGKATELQVIARAG